MRVFDASTIDARSRVEKCLAFFDRRFKLTASPCASGLTNTSGGRSATFIVGMRPSSTPARGFPVKPLEKAH